MDLNAFNEQIVQLKRMGSSRDIKSKIPGLSQMTSMPHDVDLDREVDRTRGILQSMMPQAWSYPF
jgi:signal recognition particle GTPase